MQDYGDFSVEKSSYEAKLMYINRVKTKVAVVGTGMEMTGWLSKEVKLS